MSHLANLLTLLSLFCGFASVVFSLEQRFGLAAWALIASMVLDGIDGQVARRSTSSSTFGRELDSLADAVCFGVAPAILGYGCIYQRFHLWAILALFIYLSCSIIRLAYYNVTPKEKMAWFFYGLPTTASGGLLASFVLVYMEHAVFPPEGVFLSLACALSVLMVSRVRYLNLDGLRSVMKQGFWLVILAGLVLFFFSPGLAIFSVLALYVVVGPFLAAKVS